MTDHEPEWVLPLRPQLPVSTQRLRLRPFTDADFPALLAFQSIPELVRFIPYEPRTPETMRAALDIKLAATEVAEEGKHLAFAVTTVDDELVGDLVLILRSVRDRTMEIGYIFRPEAAGQGLATEATRALLGIAFDQLGARRVMARVDERNVRSRRVCERLGMRQEALLIENEWFKGELTNEVNYALLAREWADRPEPRF